MFVDVPVQKKKHIFNPEGYENCIKGQVIKMKYCDENPFSHEGAGTKLVQFASEIPAQWLRCERNFSEKKVLATWAGKNRIKALGTK